MCFNKVQADPVKLIGVRVRYGRIKFVSVHQIVDLISLSADPLCLGTEPTGAGWGHVNGSYGHLEGGGE
jgi:hypothetical protein